MFVHLAIHYPRPEYVDDVLASMHRVDKAAEGTPASFKWAPGATRQQPPRRPSHVGVRGSLPGVRGADFPDSRGRSLGPVVRAPD